MPDHSSVLKVMLWSLHSEGSVCKDSGLKELPEFSVLFSEMTSNRLGYYHSRITSLLD